jgi:thiamine pyrophosphate-dependent acetolactate synthase large subunit-like protein
MARIVIWLDGEECRRVAGRRCSQRTIESFQEAPMIGVEAALEVLAEAGITRLFGNPGTTELPLNVAAMRDPRFQYVFGIHEIPVMAMADGFSLASRQPSFVNLHVACGLGNAMGMLFNASVEGTPLVVTTWSRWRNP